MGMVNCCNFGNPEVPESYWYFSQAVQGMGEFCKEMRIPIVGGNVSFYNEDEATQTAIKATPMIMMVGIIEGQENIITLPFKESGNDILLIGKTRAELGGSEFHNVLFNIEGGIPPKVDEEEIKARWKLLFDLYRKGFVKSNHDVSKGGIMIAIAEMCFKNNLGANLDLTECYDGLEDYEFLFSETIGRFIIETKPEDYDNIVNKAKQFGVQITKLGSVNSEPIISVMGLKKNNFTLDVKKLKHKHKLTIPNFMEI
jgi:phosphoribosylformylglycinamidine synthase